MIDKSVAIIDDNRSIAFSSLTNIVNKTAHYYFEHGINRNNNIAILGNNSIEYVIAIYALWKIGAIPVPINTRLTDNEITSILHSSNCNILLHDSNFTNRFTEIDSIIMVVKSEGQTLKTPTELNPNDTAVIIYTSGSSGKPKGVEITNNNLYQSYIAATKSFAFSSSDKFLASLPFYHIGGFAIINRALLSGGTLVLPKSIKQMDIVESMTKQNPTVVSLVPTMLKRMLKDKVKPNNKLRYLFLGGGPSDNALINTALSEHWLVVKVYGSSETTAMVTASWGNSLKMNPSSAGKPFSDIKIVILSESYSIVDNNIIGEIAIKGSTIAKGYYNNSKLWEEKIHKEFYLTGDFGYLNSDGVLFVVARRTDLIVSGGENIDPKEIEKYLNDLDEVNESLVLPIDHSEWGQIPVAIIVLNESASITEQRIIEYLKSKISSYKIPKKILFASAIPKTELGKVNMKQIERTFKDFA